jgi:hypothetical protein
MMELAHDRYGLGGDDWQPPLNVLPYRVCERSGLVPNGVCPGRTEQFFENTNRLDPDTYWKKVTIDSQTRQLATANTPITLQQEQVFFIPPEEALEWWRANQLPLPPTDYDTITRPDLIRFDRHFRANRLGVCGWGGRSAWELRWGEPAILSTGIWGRLKPDGVDCHYRARNHLHAWSSAGALGYHRAQRVV